MFNFWKMSLIWPLVLWTNSRRLWPSWSRPFASSRTSSSMAKRDFASVGLGSVVKPREGRVVYSALSKFSRGIEALELTSSSSSNRQRSFIMTLLSSPGCWKFCNTEFHCSSCALLSAQHSFLPHCLEPRLPCWLNDVRAAGCPVLYTALSVEEGGLADH